MTGDDLRAWRKRHRLTQSQLAAKLGRERTTIYLWETGQRTIPAWVPLAMETIARALQDEKRPSPEDESR